MLSVCIAAQWKGDKAERLGVAFAIASAFAALTINDYAPQDLAPLLLLGVDAVLAGGFLFLAIRYASLWLGAAMIFQAGQFALHAIYTASELPHDYRYAVINNLVTYGIFAVILFATLVNWRKRVVAARAEAATSDL
jgi:hypothetical protein